VTKQSRNSVYGRPYDPKERYERDPFAVDTSVGKTDALYKAHGYHTKVPHLAIVPSILHYTEPGDIVLDGFAGSGMTGVAALSLQLLFLKASESMGNHDSEVVGACSVD
jgi:DNA modification methylase